MGMQEATDTMSAQEISVREKQELREHESTRPGRTYLPEVDICETNEALWLWADMPGVQDDSLTIHLDQGVLTIEGAVDLHDYESLTPVYSEYNVGNYARRFTLSDAIDHSGIQARLRDGVLELQLPKTERAKPKRIPIAQ